MELDVRYQHTDSMAQTRLVAETDIEEMFAGIYGERYREYRRRWALACTMQAVEDFPLSLEFETSNTCNYKCNMCIYAEKSELHPDYRDKRPLGYMDFEMYKAIIDEAATYGLQA